MKWRIARDEAGPRDPAASMAMLQEVLDRPLDPGYESAAEKRVSEGKSASTSPRTPLIILTCLILGFLFSTAAITLRTPDPVDAVERTELAERIDSQQDLGDGYSAEIESLRADVASLEEAQLQRAGIVEGDEIRDLGESVGATALSGPGVLVTMNDAPRDENSPASDGELDAERVIAQDLQILTNGMWAAGAEGIVINDQRLTSTSSIRFAGAAIVVDFKGIAPPYEVRAIGNEELLEQELTIGSTGQYLIDLGNEHGILSEVVVEDEMTIPAAERLTTRVAQVITENEEGE